MLIRGRRHCGNIGFRKYAFGTRTADFHISVNAFEGVDQSLLRRAPANFDGEGTDTRLARRKRNWIADVGFDAAQAPGR